MVCSPPRNIATHLFVCSTCLRRRLRYITCWILSAGIAAHLKHLASAGILVIYGVRDSTVRWCRWAAGGCCWRTHTVARNASDVVCCAMTVWYKCICARRDLQPLQRL
jgi:hypothetical protein